MTKTILILITLIAALSAPARESGRPHQNDPEQTAQAAMTPPPSPIKVTIASVAPFLGPPMDRYRVGEQINIVITMTNTSTGPLNACVSSNLYQNLPTLKKDGEVLPYIKWTSYERLNAQHNETCKDVNLPETVLLKPNEPTMTDWFVLVDSRASTGADAWYDALAPGKYELSIARRFACCDGPMIASNKINFEVIP